MNPALPNQIRNEWISNAGKLFAEKGYGDVDLPLIAQSCGIDEKILRFTLGEKDKIYAEVFYMLLKENRNSSPDGEFTKGLDTQTSRAEAVKQEVLSLFSRIRSKKYPWKTLFLLREFESPVLTSRSQIEFILQELTSDLKEICRGICPDFEENELQYCARLPVTQVLFYLRQNHPSADGSLTASDWMQYWYLAQYTVEFLLCYLGLPYPEYDSASSSLEMVALGP